MNQPHDPQVTTDIPSAPADSPDAGLTADFARPADPLGTTDQVPGSASTGASHPAATLGADAPASDLPAVPGYRVLREIARGGMGRILAAHDLTLDRDVALKILLPGANADRFVRESTITARLPHPGIPPVHALGTLADGSPYLAMKLIAGETLADELNTKDRPRLLQAFAQVCQAVGFAHSRGVIHRDLKPANIMIGAFGEVQVMDWGLAKELQIADCKLQIEDGSANPQSAICNQQSEETQAGQVMGTPAYMAPEQARGEATDARADVFALGGILCAVLTGQPPFSGKSALEVIQRAQAADVSDALTRLDGCGADAELVALCRRCLSPDPVNRPGDGQAVADELTAYQNGVQERLQAAERERAVAVARATEQRKRRRVQLVLAVAVVLLFLGGGAFAWYSDRQATERRAEARNKEQQARQGVDANLKLATDLWQQYKFKAAEAALAQGTELATGGAPDRLAEVQQARRDLAFVVQLDDIRFRKWIWIAEEGKTNEKIAAPEYRQAFAERGLDLTSLDPTEAATRIAASAVKAEVVAAVDDWALHEPERGLQNRLLEIARRADPGPWTDHLRDPAVWGDKVALQKMAADIDPARTSAGTLKMLAQLMSVEKLNPIPLLWAARVIYPSDFEMAFVHGQWLAQSSKEGQAIAPFEAARALRPENMAVWNNLGNVLKETGQVDEAIACYHKVIALDPKYAGARVNLGHALARKGKLDEAIACYQKAIALDPNLAMAHNNLGHALAGKGQVDEAIACWRQAIALDPKLGLAHHNLGHALAGKGQVDEAIACYRQAIALDPKLAKSHNNLGHALVGKGQVDEAIACYQKAIALDPKYAMAHNNLGFALAGKGKVNEAIACYQKAIALDPKFANAHGNLGLALAGKGKLDEAIACFRQVIALDPKDATAHTNLGFALDAVGQGGEAIAAWWRSVDLLPAQPNVWYWIARAEAGRGRSDKAALAFRKVRELYSPGSPRAREAERFLKLWERFSAMLRGEDKSRNNAERLEFAHFACDQKKFAVATRLWAEALASDPKLGDDRQTQHRYHGARAAALAAAGQGKDEPPLDDTAKARLRRQALDWLKAEQTAWRKLLQSGPPQARPFIAWTLSRWKQDSDLASIRDKEALAKLPAGENVAFTKLWADVTALLKRAEEKPK